MRAPLLAAALAGPLFLSPALAHGAAEIVAHSRSAGGSRLVVDAGKHRLESDQRIRPVELPPGARVDALESFAGGWLVAGSAPGVAGSDLFLLRGDDRQEELLAPPGGRVGKKRTTAVPLLHDDRLAGVAWLEGSDARRFEVRYAAWRDGRFEAPAVVAPAGPGTQIALRGCRLADGRLLLVWAGFDGGDDEIWYSLGEGDRWSPPRRTTEDNAVPDITPAVVPSGGGALLAWARYDGSEYRLMTARLAGDRIVGARFAAPPGSAFPTFEAGPAGLALLYRDGRRSAWEIAEVAADGALGRRAHVAAEGDERPVVGFEGASVLWSFGEHRAVSSWQ
jgi:hypothetical protein